MVFSIVKTRSKIEQLKCQEDKGKPTRRLTGGYIDDLASLGKCIWLCDTCKKRFNSSAYGYEVKKDLPKVRGNCDGCQDAGIHTMYAHNAHCDGWRGK